LNLKDGDTLVIDASEKNVRSGVTNPHEIASFINIGVNVFSKEGLHAKVFVFDDESIVGSTNISQNSARNLVEAVVISNDRNLVAESIDFVCSIATERLTPEYVAYLKTIYKLPKPSNIEPGSTLWVQKTSDYEYSDIENEAHNIGIKKLKHEALKNSKYELTSIRYRSNTTLARKVKAGDLLIQIHNKVVYAPVRILGTEIAKGVDSILVIIEQLVLSPVTSGHQEFFEHLSSLGHQKKYKAYTKHEEREKVLKFFQRAYN
jgi:hypothetical protein